MDNLDQGYANERFEKEVDEDLHCLICLNVLKDPVQCQANEHYFCSPCIKRHLENFHRCPACNEDLSLETLRKPFRYLTKSLSKLNISCEYVHRGCLELVKLEQLKLHEAKCEFAPVMCSNDGCSEMINKRDRIDHETEVCKHRKVARDGCEEMMKEIKEVRKELNEMKQLLLNYEEFIKVLKSMTSLSHCNARQDIVVLGGVRNVDHLDFIKSVEKFSWSDRTWKPLHPITKDYFYISSVVYQNEIIVSGTSETSSMEALKVNEDPPKWHHFPAMLPFRNGGYKTVIHQGRLIVIGGINLGMDESDDEGEACDTILEVMLTAPFRSKLLSRMPKPKFYHGAELFGDKILIVGGIATLSRPEECDDTVLLYDLGRNEYQQMTPLPYAVSGCATVSWGDNAIVIGGLDKDGQALNTVIMYNVETGKSKMLPPVKHKRAWSTAVVTGNVLVVMGGGNHEEAELNSVECFSFHSYVWEELPPMSEPRRLANAVVI